MRLLSSLLVSSVLVASALTAQETTGGVRGRVISASGPVASADVAATSPDLLGERRALSATDGVFQLLLLPPGTYTLRVAAIGHRPLMIRDVTVRLGEITNVGEFALEPSTVQLDAIVVTGPSLTVDPVRTTVGGTLSSDDLAALPGDRDYKSAVAILPHVNTSYHGDAVNVGGSTGLENMYFIDGMNVTSELTASTGTSLPYNFVREVEVKAGGYEAQYGKALGAVVNAITYSGTNELETHVFGFATPGALVAEPKALPALRETGSVSYDVGARVSGPVVWDRLWFSAAYNARVDRVNKDIPSLGVYTDRTVANIFAGKLTWRATPRATVELELFGDPRTQHQVAPIPYLPNLRAVTPDPFLSRLQTGGVTGSLRTTAALGPDLLLEAAVAYSQGRQSTRPETNAGGTQPEYQDLVAGTVGGGIPAILDVSQGRTTVSLRASLSRGRHTVVGGLEFEDARVASALRYPGASYFERTDTAAWLSFTQSTTGRFHNRVPTAYVQDAWRPLDRLTLSAGLRWSAQFLSGAHGETAQRFPDEWQPRAGFSWQLGRHEAHRLFGSYGRFYQQIPLNVAAAWYADVVYIVSSYSTDPRLPGAMPDAVANETTLEKDWARSIAGLSVENFDEYTVGYEGVLAGTHRITVRGIRRDLRSSFQFGMDPSLPQFWVLGTPGKGSFAFLPPPKREYTALEISLGGTVGRLDYRASYVLSRTWGNHSGLYWSDMDLANPGWDGSFAMPWQATNSTGLLPNDRTHVFKAAAAYRPVRPLRIGAVVTVQSGTPENDFGMGPGNLGILFLAPRGSVGRTPTIWDLSLRFAYDLPWNGIRGGRVVLDLLHVGNPRSPVEVDEQHYLAQDASGQQSLPNPNWLRPKNYQPPMAMRLGVEVNP